MQLDEFDYFLPKELIAQRPLEKRDQSRMLVLPKGSGVCEHRMFFELPNLLLKGDVLVQNDTQVIPARIFGHKPTGGRVELLLDRPLSEPLERDSIYVQRYTCLVRASKPMKKNQAVLLPDQAQAIFLGEQNGSYEFELRTGIRLDLYLRRVGQIPLPVYITRERDESKDLSELDRIRYQTVYANKPGAVAAPTAGLHFTEQIMERIRNKGVQIVRITLHVGPGTFLPVRTQNVDEHTMHAERYHIESDAADAILQAKRDKRRIVAVGTTAVRALEGAFDVERLDFGRRHGLTTLFIRPGYRFRLVDGLLTNFHLPKSTLLMLVSALAGKERVMAAYREAVEQRYRFYSYGDSMFIA